MRLLTIAAAVCAVAAGAAVAADAEYRGFWADGFNQGFRTPEQIDQFVSRLQESNCNAVWPQFRKRGDAHYRSNYEPWAREDPQHFDALAYFLQRAHAANPKIEVHAWLNSCAVGGDTSPNHILKLHPEYTSISDEGVEYDNEAMKIDPGHPGAADWTFRVYLDVVRNYDVDGVHFDFVRYGHPHWGFNPVSVALFNRAHNRAGQPAWDDPAFQQWRRDQVTNLVRKVYAHVKAVKPDVKVSAATIGWGGGPQTIEEYRSSPPYSRVYQDWESWMREGILDLNCPMFYFNNDRHREYWLSWTAFAKNHKHSRQLVMGQGVWLNTIDDTFQQIADARSHTPAGNTSDGHLLYSYAGTHRGEPGGADVPRGEFYGLLAAPSGPFGEAPFAAPASIPPLPERKSIVKGFVLTHPWLAPVVGAEVRLVGGGAARTMKTDITGFYAFIDVPGGGYRIEVSAPNLPRGSRKVGIRQPDVLTANFYLGSARETSGGNDWIVTGGDNRFDGLIYVWDPERNVGDRIAVQGQVLPLQTLDQVAIADAGAGKKVVRFVGISPRMGSAFRPAAAIADLLGSSFDTGCCTTVKGIVERLIPNGFVLKDDSAEIPVTSKDLKEDYRFTVDLGARVSVRGIVDARGRQRLLCPCGPEDIQPVSRM